MSKRQVWLGIALLLLAPALVLLLLDWHIAAVYVGTVLALAWAVALGVLLSKATEG